MGCMKQSRAGELAKASLARGMAPGGSTRASLGTTHRVARLQLCSLAALEEVQPVLEGNGEPCATRHRAKHAHAHSAAYRTRSVQGDT